MRVAKAHACLNTGFSSQLEEARKRSVSNGRRSVGKWTDNIRFVMITIGARRGARSFAQFYLAAGVERAANATGK